MRIRQTRFVRLLLGVVAAGLALLGLTLLAIAAPGPGGQPASASSATRVSASAAPPSASVTPLSASTGGKALLRSAAKGKRGRRGKRGPRGKRGAAGLQGSPITRQPISIDWQNNAWQEQSTQEFTVPGIGTGNVTCKPPYDNGPANREPGGTQWVQVFPEDSTGSKTETVMWTTRFGGPPSQYNVSVVRTAKLLNTNYGPSFYEGMDTQSGQSVDPESQGMFTGIISSRNKTTGADVTPPTTFVLSWHWTFANLGGDPSQNRCYVAGNVYTGR